jgi:hypothetical protein
MKKLAKTFGPMTGFYLGSTQPIISVVGTRISFACLYPYQGGED